MSSGGGWIVEIWLWGVALLGFSWMLAAALLLSRPKAGYTPSLLLPWSQLLLFLACVLPGLLIWRGDVIANGLMGLLEGWGFRPPEARGWVETLVIQDVADKSAHLEAAPVGWPAALGYGVFLLIAVLAIRRWSGLVSGWLALKKAERTSESWSSPLIVEISERLQLSRAPEVRLLQQAASPMTFGWWRATVFLPADFPRLEKECQRAILCHELLHIRRRDWLWAVMERSIAAPWELHPWTKRLLDRLSVLREQAVDQMAVELTGCRKAYLRALLLYTGPAPLNVSQARTASLSGSTALAFQQSHLRQRVAQLTEEPNMSPNMSKLYPWTLSAGFAVALISAVLLMVLASPQAVLAGAAESVYSVDDQGVTKPIRLEGPAPAYPEVPREEKVQGVVVVKTVIGPAGRIEKADVLKSIGPVFSQAVLDVLPQWRFEPATLNGEPISVQYNLTFNFRLKEKQESEEG